MSPETCGASAESDSRPNVSDEGTDDRDLDRRSFVRSMCAAGICVAGLNRPAGERSEISVEPVGMLVDTTRCAGCRMCEFACAEAHGLPKPEADSSVFEQERSPSETQWTVVDRRETEKGTFHAKRQCMHCLQPACAVACLTKAMRKRAEGPVVWREANCMGCRYCMVACPFDVPKFEFRSAVPKIQKCNLCWERLEKGEQPACAANCPTKALMFGKRSELIAEARRRIHENGEKYYPHIYGEHEVGGTSWLYLSAVPFEQLGLPTDLGTAAYPTLTKEFLFGVPIVLTLLPPMLLGLARATKREDGGESRGEDHA